MCVIVFRVIQQSSNEECRQRKRTRKKIQFCFDLDCSRLKVVELTLEITPHDFSFARERHRQINLSRVRQSSTRKISNQNEEKEKEKKTEKKKEKKNETKTKKRFPLNVFFSNETDIAVLILAHFCSGILGSYSLFRFSYFLISKSFSNSRSSNVALWSTMLPKCFGCSEQVFDVGSISRN